MRTLLLACIAVLLVGFCYPAHAANISYEGELPFFTTVSGQVSGSGLRTGDAAGTDFWFFRGNAGANLDFILGSRVDPGLDMEFALYKGFTSADQSEFRSPDDGGFGGLKLLAIADDEINVANGPFGDPLLMNFVLPTTGLYTLAVGGSFSDGMGPFGYGLTLAASPVPIPLPAAVWLFGAGALGVLGVRRKLDS